MQGGTGEIRNLMEQAVPRRGGEPRKSWFYRLAHQMKVSTSRAESLYYHSKCRVHADEYARLTAISGHIQKVHSDIHTSHHILGDELHEIIGDIERSLQRIKTQFMAR